MTDEEFEAAIKLDDSTARTVTYQVGGVFYSKIMTLVKREANEKAMWVTRLTTTGHKSPGYAIYVLKKTFIERGIPPLK